MKDDISTNNDFESIEEMMDDATLDMVDQAAEEEEEAEEELLMEYSDDENLDEMIEDLGKTDRVVIHRQINKDN